MIQWILLSDHQDWEFLFTITNCLLFISLSWLVSVLVFSSAKLKHAGNPGRVFISSDRMNRFLGVYIFSYIIINSPLKFLNLKVYLKNNSFKEIIRVNTEIRKAERSHLFAFVLVTIGSIVFLFFSSRFVDILSITFSNVLFNLYPALSLQLQRSRISKMIRKQNHQGQGKDVSH